MPYCPKCGEQVREGDVFCSGCGARLGELGDTERMEGAVVKTPVTKATTTEVASTEIPKVAKGFLTYVDNAVGFSISYPEGWTKVAESADFLVSFEAPEEKYGNRADYTVAHDELRTQTTIQGYFDYIKRYLQGRLRDYTPIVDEELTVDRMPAIKHVYTFSDRMITVKRMILLLKQGRIGWIVTFTSSAEAFDSYQRVFEAAAASFHLSMANRGAKARVFYSEAAIKKQIRYWAIALIILAFPVSLLPWSEATAVAGGLLILLGIVGVCVPSRTFFILNGVFLILTAIISAFGAVEEGWRPWFLIVGIIFAVHQFINFGKYQSLPTRVPKGITKEQVTDPATVGIAKEQAGAPNEITERLITAKPKAAGILSIVAGVIEFIMGISFALLYALLGGGFSGWFIIAGIIAIVGGVYAIKRKVWPLALAGAICSLGIIPLGIATIILVALAKNEFK